MGQARKDIVAWIGSHVLPHEAAVRAWLRRWTGDQQDIDDAIQEAYCRLAAMEDVRHIGSGRAYLFQTTRNIVLEHARRSKIVRIDNVLDIDSLNIADDAPSQERILAGAHELQRVERLIDGLPPKCRRVFVLRKVHGASQREIARMFGISESAVEKLAVRGLKWILKALESEAAADLSGGMHEQSQDRARDR